MPSNPAFDALIAQAAAHRSDWWRVLLAIVLFTALYLGISLGSVTIIRDGALLPLGIGPDQIAELGEPRGNLSPPALILLLMTFLSFWIALIVAVRVIHLRRFRTLFAASGCFRWRHFLHGAAIIMAFQAMTLVAYIIVIGAPERTDVALPLWLLWIVPVLVLIFFQATAEELIFRGYLLQQFAVWSRNPLIWGLVPSLIFAVLHYDPSIPPLDLAMMIFHIFTFGLIAALLVWKTGSLAAAMGVHVVNNWFAMTLIGAQGVNMGFELWLFPEGAIQRMFYFDMTTTVIATWLIWKFYRPYRTG